MSLSLMHSLAIRERNRLALAAEMAAQNAQEERMRLLGRLLFFSCIAGIGFYGKVLLVDTPSDSFLTSSPRIKTKQAHKMSDPDLLLEEVEKGAPMRASLSSVPNAEVLKAIGGAAAEHSKVGQELSQAVKEMEKIPNPSQQMEEEASIPQENKELAKASESMEIGASAPELKSLPIVQETSRAISSVSMPVGNYREPTQQELNGLPLQIGPSISPGYEKIYAVPFIYLNDKNQFPDLK